MEQTALFGPPLALNVPEYQPPPPPRPVDPRVRLAQRPGVQRPWPSALVVADASAVVSLGIARQRLRGVKSTRTMNYYQHAPDAQA